MFGELVFFLYIIVFQVFNTAKLGECITSILKNDQKYNNMLKYGTTSNVYSINTIKENRFSVLTAYGERVCFVFVAMMMSGGVSVCDTKWHETTSFFLQANRQPPIPI